MNTSGNPVGRRGSQGKNLIAPNGLSRRHRATESEWTEGVGGERLAYFFSETLLKPALTSSSKPGFSGRMS